MGCFGTFAACFIILCVFVFFFAGILFNSVWGIIFVASLILTAFIQAVINLESKIENLEKRIKAIEGKNLDVPAEILSAEDEKSQMPEKYKTEPQIDNDKNI